MSNEMKDSCGRKRWSEWSLKTKIGVIAAAMVFAPVFLALSAGVTMWLWNWLMPEIFRLPAIGFWQAVGILLLSQILFRGSRIGRMGRSQWRRPKGREQALAGAEPKPA